MGNTWALDGDQQRPTSADLPFFFFFFFFFFCAESNMADISIPPSATAIHMVRQANVWGPVGGGAWNWGRKGPLLACVLGPIRCGKCQHIRKEPLDVSQVTIPKRNSMKVRPCHYCTRLVPSRVNMIRRYQYRLRSFIRLTKASGAALCHMIIIPSNPRSSPNDFSGLCKLSNAMWQDSQMHRIHTYWVTVT
jgi:hypothetical protein